MIISFHNGVIGTEHHDRSSLDPFPIKSGLKQKWVLAPPLFGIFISLPPSYALHESEDGTFIHTRSDGNLFNLLRLRANTKVHQVLIREMLFADNTALTTHSEEALQRLISCLADACREFSLSIQPEENQHHGPTRRHHPKITIEKEVLEVFEKFACLGSTISNNLFLDASIHHHSSFIKETVEQHSVNT
jgi:hypothetical protein